LKWSTTRSLRKQNE